MPVTFLSFAAILCLIKFDAKFAMDDWQLNISPVVQLQRLDKTFVQFALFCCMNRYCENS